MPNTTPIEQQKSGEISPDCESAVVIFHIPHQIFMYNHNEYLYEYVYIFQQI